MVSISAATRPIPLSESALQPDAKRRFAIILLSGGLDSTTVAAVAKSQGHELLAVTVQYGQTHRREVLAAKAVAQALGVEQRIVDVSFFRDLAWYSALTHPDRFTLPSDRATQQMDADIPITYVPLRNTFFLTLGAALLESQALHAIEVEGALPEQVQATLFIAANAIDYSGYPDCRPEFYASAAETLRLGSKLGTQYGIPFRIETPLIALTKADTVRLALQHNAPLAHTWSCYAGGADGPRDSGGSGNEHPCGRCDSCLLRAKGFAEADIPDPALL